MWWVFFQNKYILNGKIKEKSFSTHTLYFLPWIPRRYARGFIVLRFAVVISGISIHSRPDSFTVVFRDTSLTLLFYSPCEATYIGKQKVTKTQYNTPGRTVWWTVQCAPRIMHIVSTFLSILHVCCTVRLLSLKQTSPQCQWSNPGKYGQMHRVNPLRILSAVQYRISLRDTILKLNIVKSRLS